MTNKPLKNRVRTFWLLSFCLLGVLGGSFLVLGAPQPQRKGDPPKPLPYDPGNTVIVLLPKRPSHKIICSCKCGAGTHDDPMTFDEPAGGCSTLDGTKCGAVGQVLVGCKREVDVIKEQVVLADKYLATP